MPVVGERYIATALVVCPAGMVTDVGLHEPLKNPPEDERPTVAAAVVATLPHWSTAGRLTVSDVEVFSATEVGQAVKDRAVVAGSTVRVIDPVRVPSVTVSVTVSAL